MFLGLAVEFWKYVRRVTYPLHSILLRFTWRTCSTDPKHVTDVCAWWYEQRLVYPRLHRKALDYLMIPGVYITSLSLFLFWLLCLATLVDVKHVFSQGRLLLSHVCSCLSVQSTHALMCLGVWSHLGYVKDNDIKAVVILPQVPANEKEEELALGWDSISH